MVVEDYKVVNVRVSSYLLSMFSQISNNKYGIATSSKMLVLMIDRVYQAIVDEDTALVNNVYISALNEFPMDKKYTVKIRMSQYQKLVFLAGAFGVSTSDMIRKIISFVVFSNVCIICKAPFESGALVKTGMITIRLWCNKDMLTDFRDIYKNLTGEWNLTAALSDIMKGSVFTEIRKSQMITIGSRREQHSMSNDYKYNFTVPVGRYIEYQQVCKSFGTSPYQGLRDSILHYVTMYSQN